jgi:hypothetical protein
LLNSSGSVFAMTDSSNARLLSAIDGQARATQIMSKALGAPLAWEAVHILSVPPSEKMLTPKAGAKQNLAAILSTLVDAYNLKLKQCSSAFRFLLITRGSPSFESMSAMINANTGGRDGCHANIEQLGDYIFLGLQEEATRDVISYMALSVLALNYRDSATLITPKNYLKLEFSCTDKTARRYGLSTLIRHVVIVAALLSRRDGEYKIHYIISDTNEASAKLLETRFGFRVSRDETNRVSFSASDMEKVAYEESFSAILDMEVSKTSIRINTNKMAADIDACLLPAKK